MMNNCECKNPCPSCACKTKKHSSELLDYLSKYDKVKDEHKSRSRIHLCLDLGNGLVSFEGTDGRKYAHIWEIRRRVHGKDYFIYAKIGGKKQLLDTTCPTFVDKIPKDAVKLPEHVSQFLHNVKTHDWAGYMSGEFLIRTIANER